MGQKSVVQGKGSGFWGEFHVFFMLVNGFVFKRQRLMFGILRPEDPESRGKGVPPNAD